MSNVLVTSSILAKEGLAVLENMLDFAANVNRDYEGEFSGNMSRGYAPGQTINIKRPPRYQYRSGRVAVPQATVETTVPLTLQQGGTEMVFSSLERTLSLSALEQKMQAAMAPIANEIDRQGLELARFSTYNAVGTVGTLPNTQALALQAFTSVNQRLDEMGAPRDNQRCFVMNPALNGAIVSNLAGLFNPSGKISSQTNSGMVETMLGLKAGMDQNVQTHTNGTQAATGTNINGAGQTGSTITVVGLGGNITRGTVITLPGVFAVNPQSRQSTGQPAQFVVTADALAGATTLQISPAIVPSGAFQNVTASPTTGAAFTILGAANAAYTCSIGWHRDAFTLAAIPLYAPPGGKGVISSAVETHKGMSLRVVEAYDVINDNHIFRFDVLFGWAATYPELAVKYVV